MAFCALGAFVLPAWAHAQAAPQPADDSVRLPEVVITAQRREESLQRAAISVSAVDEASLRQASVTTAANLSVLVPSLQGANQAGSSVFFIRGIGSRSLNPYSEPAVAFNLNGVYVARANTVNGQFFDVERVEVLKGPQGTLYGRNATGGAINLITRRAALGETSGYIGAQFGNYDARLFTGALNLPLGEQLAARVAFQTEDHDGYFRDGTDDAEDRSVRLSLRYEPTSALTVNLIADYSKLGGRHGGAAALPLGTTPIRGGFGDPAMTAYFLNAAANRFIFPGAVSPLPQSLSFLDAETTGIMADVQLETDWGVLTVIPAYRRMNVKAFLTSIGHWFGGDDNGDQSSLEVRLASKDDQRLQYVLGAFYLKEDIRFHFPIDSQFVGVVDEEGSTFTEASAVFGQLTYSVTDTFRVTGGARYSSEDKGLAGAHGLGPPAVFTSGPGRIPLVYLPPTPQIIIDSSKTFQSTTWKVGVEWDVAPESLLYANIGTGFRAGGFYFASANNSFRPEKVTSYTIGSKNRFADGRIQLNAEAFLLKYRDQQFAHLGFVPGNFGPVTGFPTENVGRSSIYGVEIESQLALDATTLLSLQLQYQHAEYDEFVYLNPDISPLLGLPSGSIAPQSGCPATIQGPMYRIDCSGYQLYQAPTWTVSASLRKTFELGSGATIVAGVRSRYESSRWASDAFLPETRAKANTRTDLDLTYNEPNERWSVTAYVNNVEDDDVPGDVFLNSVYPIFPLVAATLRPPRTYGVRAQYTF